MQSSELRTLVDAVWGGGRCRLTPKLLSRMRVRHHAAQTKSAHFATEGCQVCYIRCLRVSEHCRVGRGYVGGWQGSAARPPYTVVSLCREVDIGRV